MCTLLNTIILFKPLLLPVKSRSNNTLIFFFFFFVSELWNSLPVFNQKWALLYKMGTFSLTFPLFSWSAFSWVGKLALVQTTNQLALLFCFVFFPLFSYAVDRDITWSRKSHSWITLTQSTHCINTWSFLIIVCLSEQNTKFASASFNPAKTFSQYHHHPSPLNTASSSVYV